jgi:hypothetical protein
MITREELAEVLLEFHQRNERDAVRTTGVPPPFEITTSVVSLGATRLPERRMEDPPQTRDQQALSPNLEKDFYFGQNHFVAPGGHTTFTLDMQFGCHDANAQTAQMSIQVLLAIWQKPGFGQGDLSAAWNAGSWLPAQTNQAPTIAHATWTFLPPLPTSSPYGLRFQFALRYIDAPQDYAENYFIFGEHQEFWVAHNDANPAYIEGNFSVF